MNDSPHPIVQEMHETGLIDKYRVTKTDGTPTDPNAIYFVLRLDSDTKARAAARVYAAHIRAKQPKLAAQLLSLIASLSE